MIKPVGEGEGGAPVDEEHGGVGVQHHQPRGWLRLPGIIRKHIRPHIYRL
jgi:hypothetical protein